MRAILDVVFVVLDLYWFIIIAAAVVSWLVACVTKLSTFCESIETS